MLITVNETIKLFPDLQVKKSLESQERFLQLKNDKLKNDNGVVNKGEALESKYKET